ARLSIGHVVLLCRQLFVFCFFFFSSRRRHTRFSRDWSSDVCSSDLASSTEFGTILSDGVDVWHSKTTWCPPRRAASPHRRSTIRSSVTSAGFTRSTRIRTLG